MAWPFPEYIRPLMRDVLFWLGRGETIEQVTDRLTGPTVRHRAEDVAMAVPEAMRAQYFREELQRASEDTSFARVWHNTWQSIFERAYGRPPSTEELYWASTQPGRALGMMFEVTVEGVSGFRWTPTVNASWSDTMEDLQQRIRDWFLDQQHSSAQPGSVNAALAAGAQLNIALIGGALVPRIEPTIGY